MINIKVVPGAAVLFFATTAPAMAKQLWLTVPEPNVAVLLALATAGVFIGRRMAYRKPPKD